MDTEEAQEFGKEIVRYQQRRQQTVKYDFPKPGTIPVPQLERSREKRETGPQLVLSNFEVPNYEEISMYSRKPSIMSRSVPTTPHPNKEKKEVYGGARPKDSFHKHNSPPRLYIRNCKTQPCYALLGYPFHNTAAHM